MGSNVSPSGRVAVGATIPPASVAVGTVSSGWVSLAAFKAAQALLNVGAIGAAGTVDAKLEQATDANGAGVKDVANTAIVQLAKAGGDNRQVVINCRQRDLDKNNGYRFVRLSVTVGTAATFLSGTVLGVDPSYGAAAANQATTVAQTVN